VTLSRKGAKSPTRGRKLRSTGTKARSRVARKRKPRAELERRLAEALEQQAATSEVLGVISTSRGELAPVFEAVLAHAVKLCDARFGNINLCEGEAVRIVAMHGAPAAYAEERRRHPIIHPAPHTMLRRALESRQVTQVADIRDEADPAYPVTGRTVTGATLAILAGARTVLAVPMLREAELVGAILIYRQEVRPFTDKHIELVKNFASQAVIAIENTRLLNELRESLQQQTATSEVLRVISSSPGALEPVFEAMLGNAVRICEAQFGTLELWENDGARLVASHDAPTDYVKLRARERLFHPGPEHPLGKLAATKQAVHVLDLSSEPKPARGRLADLAGARSLLVLPML
jgi:transcriptional regulator with GAF, ATPase, and Fis domain